MTKHDTISETYLSKRQRGVYAYLHNYIAEHGYPPTLTEIAADAGLGSPASAKYHLNKLAEAGYIKLTPGKFRAIELVLQVVPAVTAPAEARNTLQLALDQAAKDGANQATKHYLDVLQAELFKIEARRDVKRNAYVGGYREGLAMAMEWIRRNRA